MFGKIFLTNVSQKLHFELEINILSINKMFGEIWQTSILIANSFFLSKTQFTVKNRNFRK